jgi:putative ABC transport system permease protein
MPSIFGIRLLALLGFYRARVREHPVQELLAGMGIATGVALVFAVQVANSSITASAEQIVRGITGHATLQLAARSDRGFDQGLARRVKGLPGVRRTAPLLRARCIVRGPRGEQPIELFGATPALGELDGPLTQNFGSKGLRLVGGIALPGQIADAIGAAAGRKIEVIVDGRVRSATVSAVLGGDVLGPLASSRTGLAPLSLMQSLSGRDRRLSQLLVQVDPGRRELVKRGLERIAADHVSVAAATAELDILREAAKPNDQSTSLFAAISAMVGFLFALNAMLLTVAERRRFVADLRLEGAAPRQIVTVIVFEGLVLGTVASLAGLALGALLLRVLFGDVPDYLVFAFPVGSQRIIHPLTVGVAF